MQDPSLSQRSSPADLSLAEQTQLFVRISSSLTGAMSERAAVREASDPLNLNFESTRSWFKRWKKNKGRRDGNQLFGAKIEEELVGMLEGWSLLNRPVPRHLFLQHVRQLRPDKSDWDPAGWYTSFLTRHKVRLSPRVLKGLERERVDNSVLAQTIEFANWFNDWFTQKGLSTKVLMNADETRVRIEGEQQKGKGIESTQKQKASAVKAQAGDAATYVPFHTALGEIVMSVFVLPLDAKGMSNFYLRDLTRASRGSHPTYYCFTETGWMNSDTWLEVLKKLKEVLAEKFPGLEPCLLLDKLAVHMNDDALRYCVQNRLHVAFFPAHATHFLQPSDNLLFTVFKKGLYRQLQTALLGVRVNHTDLGAILVAIAQDLEVKLTPSLISASWRNTGLHPWDKKKIIENAETNAGVRSKEGTADSPIGEVARLITQSMLQEALGETKKKKVRIPGPKQKLFLGEEILKAVDVEERRKAEEQEAKDAKREAKKKAQEEAAVDRQARHEKFVCRGSSHAGQAPPKWRSGNAWLWCTTCDRYGLCPKCRSRDAAAMKHHEQQCNGENE